MENFFVEITLLLGLATVVAILFRFAKQPPILAYILVGIFVSQFHLASSGSEAALHFFSEIGITLLLFLLGLELRLGELRFLGKVSLVAGIGQIVFTSILGFLLAIALGIQPIGAIYVSIALTFSSTIVIVKLLTDKKELGTLHGRISIGILLVQDFVAILALVLLSGISGQSGGSNEDIAFGVILSLGKAVILFIIIGLASRFVFPKLLGYLVKSQEILFIFAISWALGVAAFTSSEFIGLSIEIGGLLAGIALANTYQSLQIITKIRPLRDFFIVLFFINLGMSLQIGNLMEILPISILLSLFVLVGNPLIVMVLMGSLGYKKVTSFKTGLTVAQISEFSLIVMYMARRAEFVDDTLVSIVTLVGIITFTLSTYGILYSDSIYKPLKKYLGVFERKRETKSDKSTEVVFKSHIVLVGASRIGGYIINKIKTMDQQLVVVDYDPKVIKDLQDDNVIAVAGDISDTEVQDLAHIDKAAVIVSTNPSLEDNIILVTSIKKKNPKAKIIVTVHREYYAKMLYKAGADNVIYPYAFVGNAVGNIIRRESYDKLEKFEVG